MQSQNSFIDDLTRVTTSAMGTFAGMAREFEANARERFKEWIGGMDLVSREEFEAVKAIATQAQADIAALRAEVEALRAGAAPRKDD
jgi:BMFP domain-containing protein YqiC